MTSSTGEKATINSKVVEADVYILSSGKDKFIGFKLQEGDTIEIDSSINFQVSSSKKDAKIIHEEGLTVVKKISASDLESAIEIV